FAALLALTVLGLSSVYPWYALAVPTGCVVVLAVAQRTTTKTWPGWLVTAAIIAFVVFSKAFAGRSAHDVFTFVLLLHLFAVVRLAVTRD
ncbi:MAG: hypothetical protein JNK82_45040, partial [Myxococcaceae bacterium]|nr:hypothetical protein [Myxococcaceae bacterium]